VDGPARGDTLSAAAKEHARVETAGRAVTAPPVSALGSVEETQEAD
jgi:hypothetical protein